MPTDKIKVLVNQPSKVFVNQSNLVIRKISDLRDVDLTGLSNNDILVYDQSVEKWIAKNELGSLSLQSILINNNVSIANNTISTANGSLTIDPAGALNIQSDVNISGTLNVNGINVVGGTQISGNTTIESLTVSDLTQNRIVFVGANSKLIDSNELTFDGSTFEIDTDLVRITGDLIVEGNTTTVNSEQVLIKDNIIVLNSNLASNTAPTLNAGITVNRGSSANVSIIWDETNDYWSIGTNNISANEFIGKIDCGIY